MQESSVDLSSLFQAAAQNLAANQQRINQADAYNGDHGTNMVQTFQTISSALDRKKGSAPSTALNYAAKQLSRSTQSGSGKIYAENLTRAAAELKGRPMDERGALDLLQTLIGGGQSGAASPSPAAHPAGGDEMLGAMLGGLTGGTTQNQAPAAGNDMLGALLGGLGGSQSAGGQPSGGGGDLLGSLLGGLTGSQGSGGQTSQAGSQPGLDMGDLLNAGMAFMQAKQSGGNTTQALMQAFMAGSGMGNAPHREQSTAVVVNSFLQALTQGR